MADIDHYTYRCTWSAEDGQCVGTCLEFPSLSWLSGSALEATMGIRSLVDDVVNDMAARGELIPEPLADRQYSGEFRVRILPALHRELVMQAAEQGVSLNGLASAKLASPVG